MNTLNNVPSQGTFGQSIAKINENFSLLQEAISELSAQESLDLGYFLTSSELQAAYPSPLVGMSATVGTQFEIYRCETEGVWSATGEKTRYTQQVVTSLPSNPDAHTIYALQGTDSWTEQVYSNGAWVVLATHSGAIPEITVDATPTENSTNPVQSGGVKKALGDEHYSWIANKTLDLRGGVGSTLPNALGNTGWGYVDIQVNEGDIITLNTRGGNYGAWGWADANNVILSWSGSNVTISNQQFVAPTNAKRFISNCYTYGSYTPPVVSASDSVQAKFDNVNSSISSLQSYAEGLVAEVGHFDETIIGAQYSSGYYIAASNGGVTAASGYGVCKNIPVIPNSHIKLVLTSVTSAGGRGFAFYQQDGMYISGVAAVNGTKVYEMNVPSNARSLGITLWGNSTEFDIYVTTSSTNEYASLYNSISPSLYSTISPTEDSDLNAEIDELYIPENIRLHLPPNSTYKLACNTWNGTFNVSIMAGLSAAATVTKDFIKKGEVIELKATSSSLDWAPVGTTLAYAILNRANENITRQIVYNYDYYGTLKNSPKIAAYLCSKDNKLAENQLLLNLPDNITAVVGDTLQIFFRGIVLSPLPNKYDIKVTCSKGAQYPRYFEYTPTASDIGTTTFTIAVKDDKRNIISTKSCALKTIAKATSPSSAKNVLCFGASTTSGGAWPHEADRRITGSGGTPTADGLSNIAFCGAKSVEGTGYFGVGGWKWSDYTTNDKKAYRFQVQNVSSLSIDATYTNNGNTFTIAEINVTSGTGNILCSVSSLTPAPLASGTLTKSSGNGDASISYTSVAEDISNPLWDTANNKMSFIPYANTYCNGNIHFVYVWLGYNGLQSAQTDFTEVLANVKIFADTLHSEFPNAKLKIMGLAQPSIRGGMGANYGASGNFADGYGITLATFNLSEAYQEFANQEDYSGFVEFVNVGTQFDVDYNMQHTEKAVNTRNTSVTEWMDTNGVHPANAGYMQVADVVYRNIMKELQ